MRVLALLMLLAGPAWAFEVPSGQPIDLHEVLIDETEVETYLRFRFLAPRIARDTGDMSYMKSVEDIEHLCANVAIPYIDDFELEGEIVVISLADRVVEFGARDADATQFFDAFRVQDGACIWEPF